MSDFIIADHWSKVEPKDWSWPSFSPQEVASRGDGSVRVSRQLMNKLQSLRTALKCPLILNSVYRDPAHNKRVGGAKNSYHVQGFAADVSMANHDPEVFEAVARQVGFTGFGFYPPKKGNFVHLDIGPRREWGQRWKAKRFDEEPKPKTAKKTVLPIALTTTAAGVAEAVKPDNLTAIQSAIQPMIQYAPVLQGVFAACGFGVVAWMLWARFGKKAP